MEGHLYMVVPVLHELWRTREWSLMRDAIKPLGEDIVPSAMRAATKTYLPYIQIDHNVTSTDCRKFIEDTLNVYGKAAENIDIHGTLPEPTRQYMTNLEHELFQSTMETKAGYIRLKYLAEVPLNDKDLDALRGLKVTHRWLTDLVTRERLPMRYFGAAIMAKNMLGQLVGMRDAFKPETHIIEENLQAIGAFQEQEGVATLTSMLRASGSFASGTFTFYQYQNHVQGYPHTTNFSPEQ
jgi:hypothetical protein